MLIRRVGKYLSLSVLMILFFSYCSRTEYELANFTHAIPLTGNSWVVEGEEQYRSLFGRNGLENWSGQDTRIRTYFYVENSGTIDLACRAKVKSGKSEIKFVFNGEIKNIAISNTKYDTIPVGKFKIDRPGYQELDLQGIKKNSEKFPEITDLLIGGEATEGKVYYVKDDFYFGRRGPSVHLNYIIPEKAEEVVWFYNEIEVPKGEDVVGSFFMANGFSDGYFGIQVNSENERRILFSVWSPYHTNNPEEIPEHSRIKLLKKGPNVNAGKFGGEGSGGQSYRKYYWKAGTTYRFLLKGEPANDSHTDYTAYFYAPEIGKWELIASFRRPKSGNYLQRLHSFLENFIPSQGNISRKAYYQNQWVKDTSGKWYELNQARFTADNTARKEARLDYTGGAENSAFYLKNCGFFNENVSIGKIFKRNANVTTPEIQFSDLP